jgi:hypothetical protein
MLKPTRFAISLYDENPPFFGSACLGQQRRSQSRAKVPPESIHCRHDFECVDLLVYRVSKSNYRLDLI